MWNIDDLYKMLQKTVFTLHNDVQTDYQCLLDHFKKTKSMQRYLYFVGNGGSAGIATHMTADFLKNGGMRTVGMLQPSTITCVGNGYGYEFIFSKQLEIMANESDLLVAISSSGNSPNIVNAARVARERKCQIITFTGFKADNNLRQLGDINVYVPSMSYGYVESIHNMILQQVVDDIVASDGIGMGV